MTKLTTRTSTSTRLTDTQLFVLSRAARRDDGAATLPDGMTEKAAHKLAATLVRRQLVREIRAKPGMPVWRRSEEGRSHALIITKLGRTAIKAEDEGESEDSESGVQASASTDEVASARSERSTPRQGSKLSIVIRFHTGMWAGEWLAASRYSSWEVYGKAQEGLAKDPAFAKLMAHMSTFAELTSRNITVGVDL